MWDGLERFPTENPKYYFNLFIFFTSLVLNNLKIENKIFLFKIFQSIIKNLDLNFSDFINIQTNSIETIKSQIRIEENIYSFFKTTFESIDFEIDDKNKLEVEIFEDYPLFIDSIENFNIKKLLFNNIIRSILLIILFY